MTSRSHSSSFVATFKRKINPEFNSDVNKDSFIKTGNPIRLGLLGPMILVLHLENKKIYLIKSILAKSFRDKRQELQKMYDSCSDYSINLLTHFEAEGQILLVFKEIQKFCSLDYLIENSELEEKLLLCLYSQILEAVSHLHKNKVYGCNLSTYSFIFDLAEKKLKLLDIGFSKIIEPQKRKDLYPYIVKNGVKYNEYYPPDVLSESNKNTESIEYNEKYDIWQLGILFLKMATRNRPVFPMNSNQEVEQMMMKGIIDYNSLNNYSAKVLNIINKMLVKEQKERWKIDDLLNYIKPQIAKVNINSFFFRYSKIKKQKEDITKIAIYPKECKKKIENENLISNKQEQVQYDYKLADVLNKIISEGTQLKKANDEIDKMCKGIKNVILEYQKGKEEDNETISKFIQSLNKDTETLTLQGLLGENEKMKEENYKEIIHYVLFQLKNLKTSLDESNKVNHNHNESIKKIESEKEELVIEYKKRIENKNQTIKSLENIIFSDGEGEEKNEDNPKIQAIRKLNDIQKLLWECPEREQNEIFTQINDFLKDKENLIKKKNF